MQPYNRPLKIQIILAAVSCLSLFTPSCRKAVEVSPPTTSLVSATVFDDNSTASAAVTGIYSKMMTGSSYIAGGGSGISAIMGVSADELKYYGVSSLMIQAYQNAQVSTNPQAIWTPLYNYIYQANAAIEGLSASSGVSGSLKRQLVGEAKFIRAFCYFYLVNTYGGVPLATTTNYKVNTAATRASVALVWSQMVADLKDAQDSLQEQFLDPSGNVTTERIRPNWDAATALLARVYLYESDWTNAAAQAGLIIGSTVGFQLQGLDTVFLSNNPEVIWQLQAVTPNFDTQDGFTFILTTTPSGVSVFSMNQDLLNSFEPGDLRRTHWVDSIAVNGKVYYFPYKYKIKSGTSSNEYVTVFRLAEQFLIRAEAKAQLNDLTGAVQDLNIVRNRAGLGPIPATLSPSSILDTILHERRVELFTEWGHRWFDLRRTGTIDVTMDNACPKKGGTWTTNHQLFPIPLTEIQVNPNLQQNLGYE